MTNDHSACDHRDAERREVLDDLHQSREEALTWHGSGHFRWRSSEAITRHNRRVRYHESAGTISSAEAVRLRIPF